MRMISSDILDLLADVSTLGGIGGEEDWSIFQAYLPKQPINGISVTDTNEYPPIKCLDNPTFEDETIQLMIRSKVLQTGYDKSKIVFDTLNAVAELTVTPVDSSESPYRYVAFFPESSILYIGRDENGHFVHTLNFKCPRRTKT